VSPALNCGMSSRSCSRSMFSMMFTDPRLSSEKRRLV
jgi:hypothetical protein